MQSVAGSEISKFIHTKDGRKLEVKRAISSWEPWGTVEVFILRGLFWFVHLAVWNQSAKAPICPMMVWGGEFVSFRFLGRPAWEFSMLCIYNYMSMYSTLLTLLTYQFNQKGEWFIHTFNSWAERLLAWKCSCWVPWWSCFQAAPWRLKSFKRLGGCCDMSILVPFLPSLKSIACWMGRMIW